MREFENTGATLGILVVSIYVLGLAVAPLILSPLSEQFGRLWIYHVCNLLFCAFNAACALSRTLPQLIVFRFFTGCFGAAPVSMGGGTISDVFPPHKRGAVMSLWAIGPLFGPVIGPVAGGFLACILSSLSFFLAVVLSSTSGSIAAI
jgi:multidrug resistance protein